MAQERRTLQDHRAENQEARAKLPQGPPPFNAAALTERQEALRASRGRLEAYERERQNHENLRGQLNVVTVGQETPPGTTGRAQYRSACPDGSGGSRSHRGWVVAWRRRFPFGYRRRVGLVDCVNLALVYGKATPSAAQSPVAAALERQTDDAERTVEGSRNRCWTRRRRWALMVSRMPPHWTRWKLA